MKINQLTIFLFLLYIFTLLPNIFSQDRIIKNGDTWDYFDNGYLDNDWTKKIDTYTWKKGTSPLGYGDSQITTEISFGKDSENKETVEYFKKDIYIEKDKYFGYEFKLLRDDGAVVYVNGKVLYLSNMQNVDITKNTMTLGTVSGNEELIYHVNVFDSSIFKEGKNTIAVAVYQSYSDSSDLIFSLELIGHNSTKVLEELIDNKDSANKELQYKLKDLNSKFELEKLTYRNEVLEFSNSNLKISLFIISILFLLALIAIYYVIENNKQKRLESKEILNKKKEECVEKDKEMIYLSSKVLNNKQYLKELKADVKGLSTSDKSAVKNIISEIETLLNSDEEWNILKKHFEAVYSGFYDKLLELHPELSESDLRHCMFIKLHMQTKEIARILLIDPRSVQTTRYRIKKKMNLDENTDLREYLINL